MRLVVQNKNQLPRRLRKLSAWDKGIIQRFGAYEENRNFPVELESQKEYRQKKAQVKKKRDMKKEFRLNGLSSACSAGGLGACCGGRRLRKSRSEETRIVDWN